MESVYTWMAVSLWLSSSLHAATLNVRVWGNSGYGGGQANVPNTLTNAVAISAGGNQGGLLNLALKGDSTVTSWGGNYGVETNVPPGLSNVVSVAAGATHSLALFSDHTVRC